MPLMAHSGSATVIEDVQANSTVKVDQIMQPRQMTVPRGMKWDAMPAKGDASACMNERASVMLPSWVGVALKDAPTLE